MELVPFYMPILPKKLVNKITNNKLFSMDIYKLNRNFWDFSFENPEMMKPIHSAIFFFAIEHCNRLGWKEKFGLPSQMVMEAIGVKHWRTYSDGLQDLIQFGFIKMIEISKNQYSANIISLDFGTAKNDIARVKALDKALQKHGSKQVQSTGQSTVSIDKQVYNNTIIQESKEEITPADEPKNIIPVETEESEKGMPPPEIEHPLLKSNLFRQPNIPTQNDVREFFIRSGGTDQMAECFYDKNESVGWYLRNSPITNFRNLVPSFITNWNKNEKNAADKRIDGYTSGKITGASAGLNVINRAKEEFLRSRN